MQTRSRYNSVLLAVLAHRLDIAHKRTCAVFETAVPLGYGKRVAVVHRCAACLSVRHATWNPHAELLTSEYVGGRIFYAGYSDECIRAVLASPQVNDRIRFVTDMKLNEAGIDEPSERRRKRGKIEAELRKDAEKIAMGLVAKMDNVRFLRGFGVRSYYP